MKKHVAKLVAKLVADLLQKKEYNVVSLFSTEDSFKPEEEPPQYMYVLTLTT